VSAPDSPTDATGGDAQDVEPQQKRSVDRAQFIVCAVLTLVGVFLIYDALSLAGGFAKVDPVGPKFFPLVIGSALLVTAVILGVAIARGSVGEADAGEDIDPDAPSDWRTVGLLVAMFVATIVLVEPLGWAITGALLFAGSATILGSKRYVLNIVLGVVLSVGSFYAFYSGLGIPLPAGILDGIL
jgi:putative tricarboxylic transport membrane protein